MEMSIQIDDPEVRKKFAQLQEQVGNSEEIAEELGRVLVGDIKEELVDVGVVLDLTPKGVAITIKVPRPGQDLGLEQFTEYLNEEKVAGAFKETMQKEIRKLK